MTDDATDSQQQSTLGADLLWGVQAMADELGLTLTEMQYLIRKKRISVTRLGPKTLVTSKPQLRRDVTPTPKATVGARTRTGARQT